MHAFLKTRGLDTGLLLLRITLGGILLFHGVFKLTHGVDFVKGLLGQFGLPGFFAYGVYVAEVAAPVLLFVGAWTRWAAAVIAFDMVMAVVLVLGKQLVAVREQSGGWAVELEAFIFFTAVVLVLTGSGKLAVKPD